MLNRKINTALERINSTTFSDEGVFLVFQDVCLDFSIEHFALAVFSGKKNIAEQFCVHDTYSKEWEQRYKEKQYYLYDPVFSKLKKVALPFEWSTRSFEDLLPIQRTLMDESNDFGIKSGVTIPLIPHPTFHGFATVLNQSFLHPEILYTLSLIANTCANRIISLREIKLLECLTDREVEILFQKSQGLSIKAISYQIGISEATIAFHLGNIRKKLGALSTEHALLKFISITNNSYLFADYESSRLSRVSNA